MPHARSVISAFVRKSIYRDRRRVFSTKELALISVFSSLWIVSQIYFGTVIGRIILAHGAVQRMLGWFLIIILAELTKKFGRATTMAAVASLATRIIRPGRLYSLFVGFGYALGGLTFDLLYFFPFKRKNKARSGIYLIGVSVVSGIVAFIPYLLFNLSVLGFYGFIVWIPSYVISMAYHLFLNVVGTLMGIAVRPRIDIWSSKVNAVERVPNYLNILRKKVSFQNLRWGRIVRKS